MAAWKKALKRWWPNRKLVNQHYKYIVMKKYFIISLLALTTIFTVTPTQQSHAIIWKVVTEAVKKAIKAMDLQIQRLQNKTIGLQNAQKTLENAMSKLKLSEISDWAEKQRSLYQKYYEELWKVKNAIATYKRVKQIMERQVQLVEEYKRAYGLFKQDKHFSPRELDYMYQVYSGILSESLKNIDQVLLVVNSFATQMSDGKRLELINDAAQRIELNCSDLRKFNNQNALISLQRAKDAGDAAYIKQLYGLH
jgi:hypothetical protein